MSTTLISGGSSSGGPGGAASGDVGTLDQLDLTNSNPLAVAIVDVNGDQIASFGGGQQYADAAARGTATGTLAMGDDGTNIQSVHVDTSGDLQVDVLTLPNSDTHNTSLNSPLVGMVVGGGDVPNDKFYMLPVMGNNWDRPTINNQAVSMVMRNARELSGSTSNTNDMLMVGGGKNTASSLPEAQRLVLGDGNTLGLNGLPDDPTVTFGLQTRELGQSFGDSGTISLVGTRFTVSNRYFVKTAAVFQITNNSFVGTLKPVISFDNGSSWDYVSAINATTGVAATQYVDGAAAGVFINPFGNGSSDFGFEITARTSGTLSFRVYANSQGLSGLFTNTFVQNGSGANAVNIQDGGNAITVDTGVVTNTDFDDGGSDTAPLFPLGGLADVLGDLVWAPVRVDGTVPAANDNAIFTRQVGLPAAAALADNTANPTLTQIQTFPMKWDGSTWDRWNGDVNTTAPAETNVTDTYIGTDVTELTIPAGYNSVTFSFVYVGSGPHTSTLSWTWQSTGSVVEALRPPLFDIINNTWVNTARVNTASESMFQMPVVGGGTFRLYVDCTVDGGEAFASNIVASMSQPVVNANVQITDTLDVAITGTPTVTVSGSVDANASASVVGIDDDEDYTEGGTELLTVTTSGHLRSVTGGLVNDTPQSYSPNDIRPLSLTSDGRLRVSSVDALNESVWRNTFNNPWDSIPTSDQSGW